MKRYKVTLLSLPLGGEYIVNNSGIVSKTLTPVLKRFIGQPKAMVERYIKRFNGTIAELPYTEEEVIGDTTNE